MSQRNFVVKNMISLNLGKTSCHKDKKRANKQCRGQKHKTRIHD